jgi:hypothetical protein
MGTYPMNHGEQSGLNQHGQSNRPTQTLSMEVERYVDRTMAC